MWRLGIARIDYLSVMIRRLSQWVAVAGDEPKAVEWIFLFQASAFACSDTMATHNGSPQEACKRVGASS